MTSSVLSDGTIRRLVAEGRIGIEPWDPDMVQPASVDLKLGGSFRVFHNHKINAIDLAAPPSDLTEHVRVELDQSFVIHPGEFVLGNTVEAVTMPDDLVARIEGKALALDTEVPTPDGWRTMGELEAGDRVFAASGRPTRVLDAGPVLHDRPCREVVFSDGTSVIADAEHLWEVRNGYDRRVGAARVLSTRAIERTLRDPAGRPSYHVDDARPVEYPEAELPLEPYRLGARLAGAPRPRSTREPARARDGTATLSALATDIPAEFLQASVEQRRSLLAGLMDAGGEVDFDGQCRLASVDRTLAGQYREVICSLGHRATIATRTATLDGRVCGLRHEVTFAPHEQVFLLARKAARLSLTRASRSGRAIVDVRAVPSVPVRCISVADPDGTFLVTRGHVPTHNSSLGRLGLIVHATAGFVDPGFSGTLTLEITNLTRVPIVLWPGKPIAQLSFMTLDRPAERPYGHPELGSHYHGQREATESRYEGGPRRPSE